MIGPKTTSRLKKARLGNSVYKAIGNEQLVRESREDVYLIESIENFRTICGA